MWAAKFGKTDTAKRLIFAKADVNVVDKDGKTALFLAAWRGKTDIVKLLINAGADVDNNGLNILIRMSIDNNVSAVKCLIDAKADVNVVDKHDNTALILAARHGKSGSARLLIVAKADVNAVNKDGNTALMQAAVYGHTTSSND